MSVFVEALPALLLISVLLFLSGLVVFAFRGNNFVAFITLAIVAFCALSYIALTLAPLMSHDCPYQTPLSTLFWICAQVIPLFIFSVAHHVANFFCDRLCVVNTGVVEAFRNLQRGKKKTFSLGMISALEGSAMRLSLDIYRAALCWTLKLLDEDHELEEFVAGIPGLSESEALRKVDSNPPNHAGRVLLAILPGPTAFHEQLPWSIVQLSQRAITIGLPEFIRQRRTEACLKALYYIPGAIRDVLAPYAAGTHYCMRILPLLNSPESLDLIETLRDTDNDDIALSVRCVAAAISAFIITPPMDFLNKFLPPSVPFIGRQGEPGSSFLSERLHIDENMDEDSARLQNIVLFLEDIKATVSSMDKVLLMRPDSGGSGGRLLDEVRDERRILRKSRHAAEYISGIFKLHGNRTSPTFVPAVQHDLLALTLEIVTRGSVTGAAQVQRDAFHKAFSELETSVRATHPEGHMETAEMVVDALRLVEEKLRLPASTPQLEPQPPHELQSASSRAASSSAIEVIAVTAESAPDPPFESATGISSTFPVGSYPSHSLTSSSERATSDPATFV
jgi:hypothetical protein